MRRSSVFKQAVLPRARVIRRVFGSAVFAGATLLALAATAAAQTTTGTIRGYLRGEAGNGVEAGQITARNADMGVTRTATTNTDGFYSLSGLRPGTYAVEARRIGFSPQTRTITVQIGQTLDVNFSLASTATQLAGVVVTATTVETKTSEVATNVTQSQINDLPSSSRNILDLAILAPSVRVTPDRIDGTGKTFASGAQPAEQINVFIDGASYKNEIINGGVAGQDASRGNPFPRNAVQEFRVATSNYKAEYQKSSSAIITAVTKSGTNEWRGSAFADYQNQRLVALDTFAVRTRNNCVINGTPPAANGRPCFVRPDYNRTLAGVSAGGPLIRDKLFIFGSYEGNLQNREAVTRLNGVPATWPAAISGVNGNVNPAPFRSHLIFGKLSYNMSQRQLVEFSGDARLENEKRDFGGQFSGNDVDYTVGDDFKSNVVTARVKHSYFAGMGTNELLAGYQWYKWGNVSFDFNTPRSIYEGIGIIGGHDSEQDLRQKRLSFRDDFTFAQKSWSGSHVPKVGVTVDFSSYDLSKQLNENPTFTFNASNNFATPVRASIGTGDPLIASNNTQVGLYIQDDWSPTQRLTLNLGVRWDYESGMFNRDYVTPSAVRDSINAWAPANSFVPIDPNRYFTDGSQRKGFYGAIQPRVGLSYSVDADGRTTVFAGWGIYYDRLQYNATLDEQYRRQHPNYNFNFGTGVGQIPWNASYFSRQGLLNVIASGQRPAQEVFLIPNDLKPPYSNQWSVGGRHDFGSWNGSLSYNAIRSFNGFSFEWADVGFLPNLGRNCCLERRVGGNANRTYANVLVGNNDVRTWYNGVQIQVDRPYRRSASRFGWGAGVAWTISKSDKEGNDLFSFPQVSWNARHPIADDERHRVVVNWVTDVPIKYIMGIQFSGLATLATGRPFNRNISTPQGAVTEFGASRAPNQDFIIPGAFAYRTLDLRLRKDFLDVGGNRLGVTADLFNVYNSKNFGCYSDFYGSVAVVNGQNVFTPNAGFGTPNCTLSDPRRLQIGMTYDFGSRLGAR